MSIVFDGDDEEKGWCSDCDALLYEKRDRSMICSNPDCAMTYLPDLVKKHHRKLSPGKSHYSQEGSELISLTGYAEPQRKKETVLDKEEKAFVRQGKGRRIIDVQEWLPE